MGIVIGLESTAHTLSIGGVKESGELIPSCSALFRPEEGGIHPREAADHHSENVSRIITQFLDINNIQKKNILSIAFSQGPGLGPCLRVGASVARALASELNVPLIGVNHCIAHIEIGRNQTGCTDPVLLYVSGGNTQVIARMGDKYRVIGETLDIGIGNMLDKFARAQGIPFPGGPEIEKLAERWVAKNPNASLIDVELPYGVQGMDLSFSGMLTAAQQLINDGKPLAQVCWSLQEHAFSSCIEVTERALAHLGKTEVLLGGGVACNLRIRQMSEIMCLERGASSHWPEKQYCIDNGTMIAELGRLARLSNEETVFSDSKINPLLRTDSTIVSWL
jgi:universal protein Kae1|tara:strand:- start:7902 stop:8909 length:1008 start_codon:yes stop_codon:yes gene_type:complete